MRFYRQIKTFIKTFITRTLPANHIDTELFTVMWTHHTFAVISRQ